jgi:hypothetical protein
LNTYKTALGTDAKNNVFHSLLQKTTFYREDEQGVRRYLLESNRTADGYIDFSRVNNVDGTRISRMSGETISAHVDIEKNDGIALIGLNNLITPVVNYVLMAGTRFNDIVNLINKPTVIDGKKFRSSILDYSKGKSLEDILETILERVPEDSLAATLINNSRNKYGAISRSKFISNVYKQMYAKTTQETAREELLSREEPLFDVRRLAVFLELEDQTRDLATISLAVDYDTFSPQNFESFRSASLELIPYLKEGGEKSTIFNRQGLLDVIGNTVVSPFQVQQDVLDKFVEVFPISANPKITNKILRQFAIAKETNRKLDYDRFSRVFKNDLLYALFLNNVPQAGMFEQFLDKKNPGNIGSLYTNLKSRLAQRGITAENDIFGLVSINSDINSTFVRTGLRQTELEFSVDIYKEEFEKGFNWSHPSLDPTNASDAELIADMQGFFKAFAYAGILGTQLNKKFDSYLPLIPESIYTFPMSSIIKDFTKNLDSAKSTTQLSPIERKTYSGKITTLQPNQVFVFGSNPEGRHGAGAAKVARDKFGAIYGQGEGLQGQSYALPTKDLRVKENKGLRSISVEGIVSSIKKLYDVARDNPTKDFLVSDYSGTNLSGYTGQEMADMFASAGTIPNNIVFNENFDKLIPIESFTSIEEGFFKNFIDRFKENHPELYGKKDIPVTLNYYKDYNLSRENIVQEEVAQETLTLDTTTSKQLDTTFEGENQLFLDESFAKLREINNNLSKNC